VLPQTLYLDLRGPTSKGREEGREGRKEGSGPTSKTSGEARGVRKGERRVSPPNLKTKLCPWILACVDCLG